MARNDAPHPAGHGGHLPSSGQALTISAWLTGLYFIAELIAGLWTGSIAVISDAFHTFSAVGGVLVAIAAARVARRPADLKRTFGWYRAEIVGALVNGAFLLAMAILVVVMGAMRLGAPIDLPTTPMLIIAAGGIVTEVISLYLLYRQQGEDLNVRGAYWHIIQTFVGSLIIIVAALVIHFTGFLAIDPLLGIGSASCFCGQAGEFCATLCTCSWTARHPTSRSIRSSIRSTRSTGWPMSTMSTAGR